MSFQSVKKAILDPELYGKEKAVMITLAWWEPASGGKFSVSMSMIARCSGVPVRSAQRAIKILESLRRVKIYYNSKRIKTFGGIQKVNQYRLLRQKAVTQ